MSSELKRQEKDGGLAPGGIYRWTLIRLLVQGCITYHGDGIPASVSKPGMQQVPRVCLWLGLVSSCQGALSGCPKSGSESGFLGSNLGPASLDLGPGKALCPPACPWSSVFLPID